MASNRIAALIGMPDVSAHMDLDELRQEVLDKITVSDLLSSYGHKFRKGGGRNELQSKECPRRQDHSSPDAFRFNVVKKRWQCFPCNATGDVFTYVAEMERLDCVSDWRAVLQRSAEIAGVTVTIATPEERARRVEELRAHRLARQQQVDAEEQDQDRRAIQTATAYWNAMRLCDADGERYLGTRGITPSHVVQLGTRLRFDGADHPHRDRWSSDSAPSLALYNLQTNQLDGVVRRRLPSAIEADTSDTRKTKAPTLTGCRGSGAMGNPLSAIRRGQDVIATEGIVDSITSMIAWPDAITIGSNGTGPLANLLAEIARRVVAARGRLLLVPHADEKRQGEDAMRPGVRAAIGAGLRIGFNLKLVDLGTAKDLNEAWTQGWRP